MATDLTTPTPTAIESSIDAAAFELARRAIFALTATNADQYADLVRSRIAWLKNEVKELDNLCKSRLIEIMEETGRDIRLNEFQRLYLGYPKDTYLRSDHAMPLAEDMLTACGGDLSRFVSCLCSGWAKPGATKSLFIEAEMPEAFDKHFVIETKATVKEGAAKKEAMVADSRFSK